MNFIDYFTFSRFENTISSGKIIFVCGAILARNWVAYYFLFMHWKCFFRQIKEKAPQLLFLILKNCNNLYIETSFCDYKC